MQYRQGDDITATCERWLPIDGFEGYEVSNLGRIRSWHPAGARHPIPKEPRILKCTLTTKKYGGYVQVGLRRNGKCISKRVNCLVALSFIGPKPSIKHEAAHWDGNRQNNIITNLRWATSKENGEDKVRHGHSCRGSNNAQSKLDENSVCIIRHLYAQGAKIRALARRFGVNRRCIKFAVSNITWRHCA